MKKTAINPEDVLKPEKAWKGFLPSGEPDVPKERSAWEQGVKAGNLLFVSGQTPRNPKGEIVGNNMGTQFRQVMENMKRVVKEAGGKMDDIVWLTGYFLEGHLDEALVIWPKIMPEYFTSPFPANTVLESPRLTSVGQLVEIEAIAIIE